MAKTHNKTGKFGLTFGVMLRPTGTTPLDDRLVVDSVSNLTDGTITAPYQGMVVNIAGTSDLWVLKTQGIVESKITSNWERIGGNDSISNLTYSEDSDIDELLDGDSDELNDGKLIQIKGLSYYHNKIMKNVSDTYATKEYVDEKHSWEETLPE